MRLAVYPGTFDPWTLGHQDVLERASRLFDEVIVAVADSRPKISLSQKERLDLIRASVRSLTNVRVCSFSGLLVDFVRQQEACVIVRAVRNTQDFEYEVQMASVNRQLEATIETILLPARPEVAHISGSLVRQVLAAGGDISLFVTEPVAQHLCKTSR